MSYKCFSCYTAVLPYLHGACKYRISVDWKILTQFVSDGIQYSVFLTTFLQNLKLSSWYTGWTAMQTRAFHFIGFSERQNMKQYSIRKECLSHLFHVEKCCGKEIKLSWKSWSNCLGFLPGNWSFVLLYQGLHQLK